MVEVGGMPNCLCIGDFKKWGERKGIFFKSGGKHHLTSTHTSSTDNSHLVLQKRRLIVLEKTSLLHVLNKYKQ